MNRNTEAHFGSTPNISIPRSAFDESFSLSTTFNTGDIVPLFVDTDIMPGQTVEMDVSSIVRMATPIYPVMDNLYLDTFWFFIPHRLVWDHWEEFWGYNKDPWTQTTKYEVPMIKPPTGGWTEGTIADYMALATKVAGKIEVNAFAFRSYCKAYNDFFRNENTNSELHFYTDDTTRTGTNGTNAITDCELGGMPAKAAKTHDYYTTCLPSPQKGQSVTVPLGSVAPLGGTASASTTINGQGFKALTTNGNTMANLNGEVRLSGQNLGYFNGSTADGKTHLGLINMTGGLNETRTGQFAAIKDTISTAAPTGAGGLVQNSNLGVNINGLSGATTVNLNNAYADLSAATATTISALRTAFAIQKYFENAGIKGTRYIEFIKGVFGVNSSDARLQRAEYLGGKRTPLEISQIIQTSSTDQTSPQGNTAGFSCTIDRHSAFTKSFEEHGTLMCLGVVRVNHTYQQGIDKMWTRRSWEDYYNPFFAHLSEGPVYVRELYAQGTDQDDEVFGYQERWAEYKFKRNRVTGYMRSNATGSLDVWHFADNYNNKPTLNPQWMDEPKENVDRTIAVTSQIMHQFIGNFYFHCKYVLPMPVYNIPGLIDHV